jgi:hypothetical protein
MIYPEMDWPELGFYSPERNAHIGKRRYNVKWWKRRAHKDERRITRDALREGTDPLTKRRVYSWDKTD